MEGHPAVPKITPPARVSATLTRLGTNVRTARLRRRLSIEQVAERVGCSRYTVSSVEKGRPGVSAGAYFTVLWSLELLDDARLLADPDRDDEGKVLQAARLPAALRIHEPLNDDF